MTRTKQCGAFAVGVEGGRGTEVLQLTLPAALPPPPAGASRCHPWYGRHAEIADFGVCSGLTGGEVEVQVQRGGMRGDASGPGAPYPGDRLSKSRSPCKWLSPFVQRLRAITKKLTLRLQWELFQGKEGPANSRR